MGGCDDVVVMSRPDNTIIIVITIHVIVKIRQDGLKCTAQLPPPGYRVLGLFPDRCSSGWALVHYLCQKAKLLCEFEADEAHDEHNACEWAAEHSYWLASMTIAQMVLIYSINRAPFGTGGFYRIKQESHRDLISAGPGTACFQRNMAGIAPDAGIPAPASAEAERELLESLSEYKSFHNREAGIKNSRFFSFMKPGGLYDASETSPTFPLLKQRQNYDYY